MPGKIKVKVLAGRNLPVMDRASDTTDAFVEIKFGGVTHKTDVCRKSLNPHWNSTEWYRFEVDESELQDEPLQLRLMDHDTYSANDAIGKVVISLAPLLAREINNVKSPMIPPGYRATAVHGFVEELVVNDDPEYQWIDKIRTPRASNEARQVAFIKLGNQVQRLVGLKATELGANAVVGYQQDFDLEGEAGVVARAIGTAVSISPVPVPSQPVNMPPCTQQQLKKYLDILAVDSDNVTDLNEYYQTHQEELQRLVTILNPNAPSFLDETENIEEDDEKSLNQTRQSSITSYTGNLSLYQDYYASQKSLKHITEDQSDLNRLLNKGDDCDSDSSGPLQKIKKLKTNLFSRKFRSRKSEKQDDSISIKSNSSDTSRISLTDIKNEFKKFKKLKKIKIRKPFVNKEEEGEGMASVLARSVIHAHTSLACIAETQDSEHSPCSTMRRTSESEPTINLSDEDRPRKISTEQSADIKHDDNVNKAPEIRCSSLTNLSTEGIEPVLSKLSESCPTTPMVDRSENLLKLPGDVGYFGSVSSALSADSSEVYSSSDEDDESSEIKSDAEKSVETTSSVVSQVLRHEVDQSFIAQMDKKLSILESVTPDLNEIAQQDISGFPELETIPSEKNTVERTCDLEAIEINSQELGKKRENESHASNNHLTVPDFEIIKNETDETNITREAHESSSSKTGSMSPPIRPNVNYIKLHNPFTHKKAAKSVSAPSSPTEKHGFVYRSSKRIKRGLSKLSKSSMIKSLSHYSLLPKKKQEKTFSKSGSFSDVPSKAPSDTVLGSLFMSYSDLLSLDKESLSPNKLHKSDEFGHKKVSMYIGSEPASRASFSGSTFPFHSKEEHEYHKKDKYGLKPTGLVHTAMETILIDKVQSLLIPTSPEPTASNKFFADVSERLEKVEDSRNRDCSNFDKARSLPPEMPRNFIVKKDDDSHKAVKLNSPECSGLIHTAMQTMLLDKAQTLIPEKSEIVIPKQRPHNVRTDETKNGTPESSGMVHTAMETMLMDKVQSLINPTVSQVVIPPVHEGNNQDTVIKTELKQAVENKRRICESPPIPSKGLVHTAMETMLLEKAQSILPKTPEFIETEPSFESREIHKVEPKSQSLIHTAMESSLIDKAHSVIPETAKPIQFKEDHNVLERRGSKSFLKKPKIVKTAMEKVHNLLGPMSPDLVVEKAKKFFDDGKEEKHSLVHTAMETMLMEKVQALIVAEPESGSHKKLSNITPETTPMPKPADTKTNTSMIMENKRDISENTQLEIVLYDDIEKPINDLTTTTPTEFISEATSKNVETFSPKEVANNANASTVVLKDDIKNEPQSLDQTAMPSNLIDKIQTLSHSDSTSIADPKAKITQKPSDSVEFRETTFSTKPRIVSEKLKAKPAKTSAEKKDKVLTRQDSIHSSSNESLEDAAPEMSNNPLTSDITKPIITVQVTSHLETIPSLPESIEQDSVDVDETNKASVCDNLHAVCGVDREKEREKEKEKERGSPRHARHESYGSRMEPVVHTQNSSLNASSTPLGIHRRSSDSDLSVTPKGGSLNTSAGNVGSGGGAILRPSMNSNNLDMLEYPFLTMTEYPPEFIVHIGGTVCARSVKLVDGGGESAARAAWWAELRTELRAHARALRCNAVIAYTDTAAICEDVCVLSASGTAAVINLDCDFNADLEPPLTVANSTKTALEELESDSCSIAHVPYSPGAGPYRAELMTCGGCRRARVPAVLLATCAKPNRLISYAKAVTLTAVAARVRRAPPTSEPGARDISDQLPFLEYELHKLLLAKLRMQGANALFSLQTQISVGERCVMALASGTAVRLAALPPPTPPRIKASENDKDALEIQRALWESFNANKAANGYDIGGTDHSANGVLPEVEGEDPPVLDLCADKDACVLELDEAEDVETARALAARQVNIQVYASNLKATTGAPPHAFAQVWRARLALGGQGGACASAERLVSRALHGVAYKLRRLTPYAVVSPRFQLELPEDEIQLVVSGAAIPLQDPLKVETLHLDSNISTGTHANGTGDADDEIFTLDEEQLVKGSQHSMEQVDEKNTNNGQVPTAVSLTTLCHINGSRLVRRVCALRLLFVRETTTVRELGGLSGFLHTFTCEVLAIVRAYTAALGGNALTSFYVTQLMLQDNAHKNQGQCLLSVGGDVVHITY
ncbi:hypothetical protein K1T71_012351 [Dendrolimus kikuchii]|uniref:Uncharacterized protein n=1 Tax=Dendrolimus kikuchii TaxID=765133 RepID=A0ACC1CLH0_9NEOP|nr:hypothetical protein K1T71_012351 [Dendrolimus kikuchii]